MRTRFVLGVGPVKISTTADVLAINFPVPAVAPPPAAETITLAELKKLLKKPGGKKRVGKGPAGK